ncbi:MAG: PQQ-binding-like beta-propeller repeat protein, partial [Verrucomicrobia bacterium]|nr:PQQ-binding-like beta-propeller repeat protein [Verrucomicrobiota bacterium]
MFGAANGKFYCLNPNGSLKWSFTTGAEVQSSPAL